MIEELWLGDCLELMKQIPESSVDMVCCDLPYGTTNCSWDSVVDLNRLWNEYKRITKTNAAIVLFAQTPFDKVLGASNIDDLRYEIIWEKTAATGHFNAKKMPMKAHENILFFIASCQRITHKKHMVIRKQTLTLNILKPRTIAKFTIMLLQK